LQRVVSEAPTFAQAYYYLGAAHARRQNMQLAEAALLKAVALAPKDSEPVLSLMELYLQSHHFERALQVGENFLHGQPGNVPVQLLVGRSLLAKKDLAKALAMFKMLADQTPQDPIIHYYLGLSYQSQGKEPEALAALEQALRLQPHYLEALQKIAEIYTGKGQSPKAIARIQQQLKVSPNHALMYSLLGNLALAQNQYDMAEKAFQQAIALDEKSLSPYVNLATLYARRGAGEAAIAHYETLLKSKPHVLPIYVFLGRMYDLQKQYQRANEYYRKALQIDPLFVPAANNLAWNYAEYDGNLDEALSLAHTAKTLMPREAAINDTLGWIYYKKKAYNEAIRLLKVSVADDAQNPITRYHLGMAYYKNGECEETRAAQKTLSTCQLARTELQTALRLNQDFIGVEEARKALDTLQ
jgi:tetratricopeptide (TPR) repeat protein